MLVAGEEYDEEDEDDDDDEADVCGDKDSFPKRQSNVDGRRLSCNALKPAPPSHSRSTSASFRSKLDNVLDSVSYIIMRRNNIIKTCSLNG